jgi:hypothetical protein
VSKFRVGQRVIFLDREARNFHPSVFPPAGTTGTVAETDRLGCYVDWNLPGFKDYPRYTYDQRIKRIREARNETL